MISDAPVSLYLLLIALGALAWGVLLVRRSRRRRLGETPHCRACDYDLTGNTSAVCPECGLALEVPGNVVRGRRVRDPSPFARGVLMIALALILGIPLGFHALRTFDVYRIRTSASLINDLTSRPPGDARRAWDELSRRIVRGGLSDINESRLTGVTLGELQRARQGPPNPLLKDLSDHLGDRALAGELSPSLIDQFFTAAIQPSLRLRRLVRAGDSFPVEVTSRWTGPTSNGWWVTVATEKLSIDGKIEFEGQGGSSFSGFGSGGNSTHYPKGRPANDYAVAVTQTFRAYLGPMSRPEHSRLVHEWSVTSNGLQHVVDPEPPGTFSLVDRPDLLPAMQAAITIDRFALRTNGDGRPHIELAIAIRNPPENIAFEVFADVAGREYDLGSIRVPRNQRTTWYLGADALRELTFDKADFHFRPSEKAARQTVDLFDIWNGELTIKDVPLTRPAK